MDDREKIMLQINALQNAGIKEDHPSMAALIGALQTEQARISGAKMPDGGGEDEDETNMELSMQDAVERGLATKAAQKAFGGDAQVEVESGESKPLKANSSTDLRSEANVNRITSGDEKVETGDLAAMLDADMGKSSMSMAKSVPDETAPSAAMKANSSTMLGTETMSSIPQEKLDTLFKTAHGSAFDAKSKMDSAKMDRIRKMIEADPNLLDLSPAKFALKLYTAK